MAPLRAPQVAEGAGDELMTLPAMPTVTGPAHPIIGGITLHPVCPQCNAPVTCAAASPEPWRCPVCSRYVQAAELRDAVAELLNDVTVTCGECWAQIPLNLESFSEGVVCNECDNFFLVRTLVASSALKVMAMPCPKCHAELEYVGNGWVCRSCGQEVYSADAGVVFPDATSVHLLLLLDALVNAQYARLTPADWFFALLLYPQLVARCPWNTLATSDWARTLALVPVPLAALKMCPWDKFTAAQWVAILTYRPEFAPRCPFEKFDHVSWMGLMLTQKEKFAGRCPWETLEPGDWRALLAIDAEFFSPYLPTPMLEKFLTAPEQPPAVELSSSQWAKHMLASKEIRYSPRCPWEKLDPPEILELFRDDPEGSVPRLSPDNWYGLLQDEPEKARRLVPVEVCKSLIVLEDFAAMLGPDDWMRLLRANCEFFGPQCPLAALGAENAFTLAEERPDEFNAHFATPAKWEAMFAADADRAWKLIPRHYLESCYGDDKAKGLLIHLWKLDWATRPDLTDDFPYDALSLGNWLELLACQPQRAKRFHRWKEITVPQWRELVQKQPGFSHVFNLRFPPSGKVFVQELLERPSLEPLADFTKLNGEDWLLLIAAAPQYADKCDWKKVAAFYRADWRPALKILPEGALAPELLKRYPTFPEHDRLAMLRDLPSLNQMAPLDALQDIDFKLWLNTVFAKWDARGMMPRKPDADFPWQCFNHVQLDTLARKYPHLRQKIGAWLTAMSAESTTAFLVSAASFFPENLEGCVAGRAEELSLDDWRELIPLYPPFGDVVPGNALPLLMMSSPELVDILSDEQLSRVTSKGWLQIVEHWPEWSRRCNFRELPTLTLMQLWFKIREAASDVRAPLGAVIEDRLWIGAGVVVALALALPGHWLVSLPTVTAAGVMLYCTRKRANVRFCSIALALVLLAHFFSVGWREYSAYRAREAAARAASIDAALRVAQEAAKSAQAAETGEEAAKLWTEAIAHCRTAAALGGTDTERLLRQYEQGLQGAEKRREEEAAAKAERARKKREKELQAADKMTQAKSAAAAAPAMADPAARVAEWEKAVALCRAAADLGKPEASKTLPEYQKRLEDAKELAAQAAKEKEERENAAQAKKSFSERDYPRAYAAAAKAGANDPEINYMLGFMERRGQGCAKDLTTAFERLTAAATAGHALAADEAAEMMHAGEGVRADRMRAARYWGKAAAAGIANAQWRLGEACLKGDGVDLDKPEGLRWLEQAGEQNVVAAQLRLGEAFRNDGNAEKAKKWYRRAATAGNQQACWELGRLLLTGPEGGRGEAVTWLAKAAEGEKGLPAARKEVGKILFRGDLVPRDLTAAGKWLAPLVKTGDADPETRYMVGKMLADGAGLAQNADAGMILIRQSADGGHPDATFELAQRATAAAAKATLSPIADLEEAAKLCRRAAELGHAAAKDALPGYEKKLAAAREEQIARDREARRKRAQEDAERQKRVEKLLEEGKATQAKRDAEAAREKAQKEAEESQRQEEAAKAAAARQKAEQENKARMERLRAEAFAKLRDAKTEGEMAGAAGAAKAAQDAAAQRQREAAAEEQRRAMDGNGATRPESPSFKRGGSWDRAYDRGDRW